MANLILPQRTAAAILVGNEPKHLCCSSCDKLPFNCFQTPHGCRLCELCVSALPANADTAACPGKDEECKDEEEDIFINQSKCTPDIAARREITRLQVYCPNKPSGCSHKCKWLDVDSHLNSCDYEKVQCELCSSSLLRKDKEEHTKSECQHRLVVCDKCKKQIVFCDLNTKHEDLQSPECCEQFNGPCPFNCGQKNLRPQIFPQHLAVCQQKPQLCCYSTIGCSCTLPAAELTQHYNKGVSEHTAMLLEFVLQNSARLRAAPAPAAAAAAAAAVVAVQSDSSKVANAKLLMHKVINIFTVMKKLQISVAGWASITAETEDLVNKFGGISGLANLLRNVQERSQQPGAVPSAADELQQLQQQLRDIECRLLSVQQASCNGKFLWKIPNISKLQSHSPVSVPFRCQRYGHLLQVQLHFNGCDSGEGSHLSVKVALLPSEYDEILDWPFAAEVSVRVLRLQDRSADKEVRLKLNSDSKRPRNSDHAISCCEPKLMPKSHVENFTTNDCIYVDICAEPNAAAAHSRKLRR